MTPKYKHICFEDRCLIEDFLNRSRSFSETARRLGKDRRTVAKDVLAHRFMVPGKADCPKTNKPPYVCNGCPSKGKCRLTRYTYYANVAQNEHDRALVESRKGIRISREKAAAVNEAISPLMIEKHHSVNQVYINHSDELPFSKTTFYSYIDKGVFSVRNIDLPRKVRFRKKRKAPEYDRPRCNVAARVGRFYKDFVDHVAKNPEESVVEMDTVVGTKGGQGGKCLLTLLFRDSRLMLVYLIQYKKATYVTEVFTKLKEDLGEELFSRIFSVILTDNGTEFSDPKSIEFSPKTGERLCRVFYCDPNCSWQKGMLEKNHEFIRFILPKGTSFAGLTQEDATRIADHVNSVPRYSLNRLTPYQAGEALMGTEVLERLGLSKVEPDEVDLTKKLLGK